MSLAADILRAAEQLRVKPARKKRLTGHLPAVARPKKKRRPTEYKAPKHTKIPGVYFFKKTGKWRAYFYDGTKDINIGEHQTQERAFMALRLYKFWRRRSFTDIPNKPELRIYTRSDYS